MIYVKIGVGVMLFMGFLCFFLAIYTGQVAERLYKKTRQSILKSDREYTLERRRYLLQGGYRKGWGYRLEQLLQYAGLKRRFPWLGTASAMALLVITITVFFIGLLPLGIGTALFGIVCLMVALKVAFDMLRRKELQMTEEGLMPFLDFLGNYSITSGEITWALEQISPYMQEPIKSALEECVTEAKTTGDTGMALLSLGNRLEHSQFREIVRNMEVSLRYVANFTEVTSICKRSVREYEKALREKKSMLKEAAVNMVLLLGMSIAALFLADGFSTVSVWSVLTTTMLGRIVLIIVGAICFSFLSQLGRMEGKG